MMEWVSYVGYAVLHGYIELAFGIMAGLSMVLAALMPFRSRLYWRDGGGGAEE